MSLTVRVSLSSEGKFMRRNTNQGCLRGALAPKQSLSPKHATTEIATPSARNDEGEGGSARNDEGEGGSDGNDERVCGWQ